MGTRIKFSDIKESANNINKQSQKWMNQLQEFRGIASKLGTADFKGSAATNMKEYFGTRYPAVADAMTKSIENHNLNAQLYMRDYENANMGGATDITVEKVKSYGDKIQRYSDEFDDIAEKAKKSIKSVENIVSLETPNFDAAKASRSLAVRQAQRIVDTINDIEAKHASKESSPSQKTIALVNEELSTARKSAEFNANNFKSSFAMEGLDEEARNKAGEYEEIRKVTLAGGAETIKAIALDTNKDIPRDKKESHDDLMNPQDAATEFTDPGFTYNMSSDSPSHSSPSDYGTGTVDTIKGLGPGWPGPDPGPAPEPVPTPVPDPGTDHLDPPIPAPVDDTTDSTHVEPSTPADTTPTEPTPIEPIEPAPVEPIEPTPVDPTPIEPIDPTPIEPVDTTPVEPAPVEPAPAEPVPVEPTEPTHVEPVEPAPAEPTPVETVETIDFSQTEPAPVEPTPVDTTPTEPTPVTPVDTTPAEPVEPTPVDTTPAEPIEPTPVDTTPAEPTPAEPAPAEPTPVDSTPVEPIDAVYTFGDEPIEAVYSFDN